MSRHDSSHCSHPFIYCPAGHALIRQCDVAPLLRESGGVMPPLLPLCDICEAAKEKDIERRDAEFYQTQADVGPTQDTNDFDFLRRLRWHLFPRALSRGLSRERLFAIHTELAALHRRNPMRRRGIPGQPLERAEGILRYQHFVRSLLEPRDRTPELRVLLENLPGPERFW